MIFVNIFTQTLFSLRFHWQFIQKQNPPPKQKGTSLPLGKVFVKVLQPSLDREKLDLNDDSRIENPPLFAGFYVGSIPGPLTGQESEGL